MKIAAIYDIHGNLPALEAVIEDINQSQVDQIIAGGDVVLGPMSCECLELLLELNTPVQFIKGNCEVAVLDELSGGFKGKLPENVLEDIRWTAQQILPEHREQMKSWPMTINLEIEGLGSVLFCHATPENENENFTKLTPEEKLFSVFSNVKENIVVCGHTHMQFDRTIGNTRVLNAGSVGMPFGKPGAYWLMLDSEIKFRYVKYDIDKAMSRIKNTDYPHALQFAESNVKNPPSEETMLKILSGSN
ncbi:MAG: metallophosphoesterase family protein [Cyclobacteriaceae bacterium]